MAAGGATRGGADQSAPRGGGQGHLVGRGNNGYNPGFQPGYRPGYDGGRGGYGGRGHLHHGGRGRRGGSRGRGGYNHGNYGYHQNGGAGHQGAYGDRDGYHGNHNSFHQGQGYGQGGCNSGRMNGKGGYGGRGLHHGGRGDGDHNGGKEEQAADKMDIDAAVHQPTIESGADKEPTEAADGNHGVHKGKEVQRESESSAQGAARAGGKNKPYCYRCLTKGHINTECTTQVSCDLCVTDTHVTKACPQAKAAKQQAILSGYAVDGLGFYYIPYNGKLKAQPESKAAVVTVIEGSMTANDIAVEVARLLPGSSNWVVEDKGDNTYTTTFPSRAELTRMVLWGNVQTKSVKAQMVVQEKKETEVYKYEIPKCWVQFRGLCDELREEVPIIWAVGSILGVTKMVDMRFTKQHGVARLRVAVLNPDLIPDLIEVVIGEYVYELQFRVEKDGTANNPVPINMDIYPENDGNSDGETENGKEKEGTNGDQKGSMAALGSVKDSNGEILSPSNGNSNQNKGKQKPVVVLSPSTDGSNTWTATPMSTLENKERANAAQVEPLHINANVKITPSRTSKRNAAANDQDSVERAAKLKARKNLEEPPTKGTIQGNILAPILGQVAAK